MMRGAPRRGPPSSRGVRVENLSYCACHQKAASRPLRAAAESRHSATARRPFCCARPRSTTRHEHGQGGAREQA